MSGISFLSLVILISSIPVIAVIIWFKLKRYSFSTFIISASFFSGLISFFTAIFIHIFFDYAGSFISSGRWVVFYKHFIQIAFSEEFSRLLLLVIFYFVINKIKKKNYNEAWFCAVGLFSGLGFAVLESAVIGISYSNFTWMRVFTAAPLHGACGCRVAVSAAKFKNHKAQSIFRFFSAVAIHGIYNFLIARDHHLPSQIAAVLIVFSSLVSSIMTINRGMGSKDGTN